MLLLALRDGILLGLLLSVLIGPVFFLLIELSLKEGFRSAVAMDVGIILSDAACILVAYFGMAALLENPKNRFVFVIVGSVILLVMGIIKILPKKTPPGTEPPPVDLTIKRSNPFWLAIQGFFYNLLNPSTIIFWITTVGGAVALRGEQKELIAAQFAATLAVVFVVDVGKAWFAKKMRQFITAERMKKANIIVGVVFILFSLFLMYRAVTGKI